ncbi:MAG TPA: MarC family protein [Roseomonas sp.]|nr:MarC family protein [Roseomonas sp.]
MPEALYVALNAFIALLVILDPPGLAVLFLGMTPDDTPAARRRQAQRAVSIAAVVLIAFALFGGLLLEALGIGMPAMKVAGGLLLFVLATNMALGNTASRASSEERQAAADEPDISVFPLAIPLLAGPGAMTTMVLMRQQAGEDPWRLAGVLVALLAALGVTLATLWAAVPVGRLLGATGGQVVGRVLGVILAALAAQIALDGLRASLF